MQQEVVINNATLDTSSRPWRKLAPEWIKINIYSVKFEEINCIGVSAVIRNTHGEFVQARSQKIGVFLSA